MKVVIIDYLLGNLFSVKHACEKVGLDAHISTKREEVEAADAVILPGVGAFGDAMKNLHELDLIRGIKNYIEGGKPFFGVCLGMQLLFEESEEFGEYQGLGLIKGKIKKFEARGGDDPIKVPQIGWNQISPSETANWAQTPLSNVQDGEYMYFVHSYYAAPTEKEVILTETTYGDTRFCSAVLKDNIFATQYHPEKSAREGIKIYENWAQQITSN